jgi:hypothetical protein
VIKHKGANVAPWNINRYVVSQKRGQVFVDEDPLIFYHFHSLKVYGPQDYHLYYSTYNITPDAEKLIYPSYVAELEKVMQLIRATDPHGTYGYSSRPTFVPRVKYEMKRLVLKARALLFKV